MIPRCLSRTASSLAARYISHLPGPAVKHRDATLAAALRQPGDGRGGWVRVVTRQHVVRQPLHAPARRVRHILPATSIETRFEPSLLARNGSRNVDTHFELSRQALHGSLDVESESARLPGALLPLFLEFIGIL
jgi:hypothetical protein